MFLSKKKKNLNIVNNTKSNDYQNLNDLNFAFCQKRQPKCTDIFFFLPTWTYVYTIVQKYIYLHTI